VKTCSKCKRDLPEECFVKSPRYFDGKYPSCKECRKAVLQRILMEKPMCGKCGVKPHLPNHRYCEECLRFSQYGKRDRLRRKPIRPGICPNCNERPSRKGRSYCQPCNNESTRRWLKKRGGTWRYLTRKGQRKKALARHLVHLHVSRGKLAKRPCEVCGNPKSEAHHHKGYDREHATDVRWLCKKHHDEAERVLKSLLTEQPLLL
jgi:hypothetical protein